jgi:hypothetical protein
MKQWMIPVLTLLVGAGIAVGATLGVTRPWQEESTPLVDPFPVSTPAPSQEQSEKVACLQGSGTWIWLQHSVADDSFFHSRCGTGTQPCWYCFHRMN